MRIANHRASGQQGLEIKMYVTILENIPASHRFTLNIVALDGMGTYEWRIYERGKLHDASVREFGSVESALQSGMHYAMTQDPCCIEELRVAKAKKTDV